MNFTRTIRQIQPNYTLWTDRGVSITIYSIASSKIQFTLCPYSESGTSKQFCGTFFPDNKICIFYSKSLDHWLGFFTVVWFFLFCVCIFIVKSRFHENNTMKSKKQNDVFWTGGGSQSLCDCHFFPAINFDRQFRVIKMDNSIFNHSINSFFMHWGCVIYWTIYNCW